MRHRHHSMRFSRTLAIVSAVAALGWPGVGPVCAAPAGAGVSLSRGWIHVPTVAPGFRGGSGEQIVAGGRGLVAYDSGLPGYLFASATGQRWSRLPGPTLAPGEFGGPIFAARKLLIIRGSAPSSKGRVPRLWISADGGKRWRQSSARLQISALIAGGDGIVGLVRAGTSTQWWTSADGLHWRRLPDTSGAFASATVLSIARWAHGYIAGGFSRDTRDNFHTEIWTSPNGLTWTESPGAAAAFADAGLYQVAAGSKGAVVLGMVLAGRPGEQFAIWASPDGVHWRRAADGFLRNSARMGGLPILAAWQGGFAAIQDLGSGSQLYSSGDGITWTRVGSDGVFGGTVTTPAMTAFRGGLALTAQFAAHPGPQCLADTNAAAGFSETFQPEALLWSPRASRTAPVTNANPTDPWALRLLPEDFPAEYFQRYQGYGGNFVNLCGPLPALGRHRAYVLQVGPAGNGIGRALNIVTQTTAAAQAAFRQVNRLVAKLPWVTKVTKMHEAPATVRIGDQTRVFHIHVKDVICSDLARWVDSPVHQGCTTTTYRYPADVVVWRHGRVIGMVVTSEGMSFATKLARTQLTRSGHPSD
jgi:hypothetical protein